jgi:hypothetical protein
MVAMITALGEALAFVGFWAVCLLISERVRP